MAVNSPDAKELADIHRLASDLSRVAVTATAKYDLMGAGLATQDVCGEIVAWIDTGGV